MQAAAKKTATSHKAPNKEGVLQPLDLKNVTLEGEFGRRVRRIIDANILQIDVDETFLNDFRERGKGGYWGLGKFIDSVVRLAAGTGDPRLLELKKKTIDALLATQEPDGYMGTVKDPQSRIKVIWDLHEGAYLIWALVSDHQFFGETRSLQGAQRLADYFLAAFAANPELRPDSAPAVFPFQLTNIGFDRALLVLSRVTGQGKYQDFVVDFLKLHDLDPPIETGTATADNHAYQYLAHCLAQLDLYAERRDPRLLKASRRAMEFLRQGDGLLVTGSCSQWECWHDTQSGAENTMETCASAYLARLLDALLRLEGDSLYGDIMERDIYNALFSATTPDGSRSRYHTPFEGKRPDDEMGYRFCCANNNKRFLADLRSWLYYRTEKGVAVNLYNASTATLDVAPEVTLNISQQTDYPTSGDVLLKIEPSRAARFEVKLRIPRWCKRGTVSVNGSTPESVSGGQFHRLNREWKSGDTIELKMPMPWRFIRGRRSQEGRAAILRGPMLFTFNPHRNPDISALPDFEPRRIKINPTDIEPPMSDDSVRPGGISCTLRGWPPERHNPFPFSQQVPLVLTEYADPRGENVYFIVPGIGQSLLTDDELI